MRSRADICCRLAALVLCAALVMAAPLRAGESAPDLVQVEAAKQALSEDPNLGSERTVRTLRWNSADGEQKKAGDSRPLEWLTNLFRWIGQWGRMIIWVLAALLAAGIVIYVLRLLRDRGLPELPHASLAPTHVRELDIRPESLPADIGAAARQLWDSGDTRRALALLYRGLLSRLAHAYAAPVRDSTTEGESIALARRCLPAVGSEFAASLVGIWQLAVYGGRVPDTARVYELCAGFASALDRAPAAGDA